MDKILEKVMNFINENTMLLIIICIFLIVILVIYLIDNTIKTRKLEQEELEKKNNPSPEVPETPVVETPVVETPAPVVEEVAEVAPVAVEIPVEEPKVEDYSIPQEPVIDSNIEDLLNKDYSSNNEIVNSIPEEVKVEEPVVPVAPVVEAPKSKYNNDKKLSDIFGKKEEPKTKNIETTQDFSDELDRILKKLNEENSTTSGLEETSDYTNMF